MYLRKLLISSSRAIVLLITVFITMEFPYRLKNSAEVPMNEDVEQSDAALSLRQKLARYVPGPPSQKMRSSNASSESNLPFQDLTSVRNSDTLLVATDAATAAANHESDEEDSDEQGEQLQALDTAVSYAHVFKSLQAKWTTILGRKSERKAPQRKKSTQKREKKTSKGRYRGTGRQPEARTLVWHPKVGAGLGGKRS